MLNKMIISEKQIAQLIQFINEYRMTLIRLNSLSQLTDNGKLELEQLCNLLGEITNQQSEELKVIE